MNEVIKRVGSAAASAAKRSVKKLGEIAESKKEKFIVNIQNSTAPGIFLKWLFTNKVSVLLFCAVLFYAGRSYYMENEFLKERNRMLIEERDVFLNRTKVLGVKVKQLQKNINKSKDLNNKVRENSKNLSSEQKKKEVLDLVGRLKTKRGIK